MTPIRTSVPTRSLGTLLVCQGVLTAGVTLAFPFFALYLHRAQGLPMGLVGGLLAGTLALCALAQGLGGELSDLWGCKAVMELSLALRAAFVAGLAAAMALGWPVAAVVALHTLAYFCGNLFDPALRGWVAQRTPPPRRAHAYARLRVANNLGWAVGPAVGGMLAARSYPLLFGVTAAVSAACLAVLHACIEGGAAARADEEMSLARALEAAGDHRFLEYCAYGLLIAAVIHQLVASLSVHSVSFAGLTERHVGFLFGLNGVLVILLQSSVTRALEALPISTALAAGSLLYAAGYAWVGFARGFLAMAVGIAVVTAGEVVVGPGLHALAANLAPERRQGRYLGFHGLSMQIGSALGPLLGGLGLQYLSPRWPAAPWLLVGAVGTAAGVGFYRFGRLLTPAEQGFEVPS